MNTIFCVFLTLVSASAAAPVPDATDQAARTFRSRCLSCHQPPDLTFSTDVAWLDQVNRTG